LIRLTDAVVQGCARADGLADQLHQGLRQIGRPYCIEPLANPLAARRERRQRAATAVPENGPIAPKGQDEVRQGIDQRWVGVWDHGRHVTINGRGKS
jgi:hypothetical protein